jgi:hypothetical protein
MTGGGPQRKAADAAAGLVGAALAATFGAVALVRGRRPLHPEGISYSCTLTSDGTGRSGVPWLDDVGTTTATVRVSRAVGLPVRWKDIYGMALRVPAVRQVPGEPPWADLLFASTGDTAYGRFVLRLRDTVADGPLTTLLPVRAPAGPLLLRLLPRTAGEPGEVDLAPPTAMTLSYAVGRGPWCVVADVRVGARQARGVEAERHDPVAAQLPGTSQYEVVRRLREPAYRAARRARPRG